MTQKNKLIAFLLCGVALLVLPLILQGFGNAWVRIADVALLYVMLALGLNIVVGEAGLLDLGYVAFFAVGAYLYGLLASPHLTDTFPAIRAAFPNGFHTSLWLVIPLALLLATVTGVLLGIPVLKLRGDYLAIVTLGFGEIIRIFLNNLDYPYNLTNGPKGVNGIDPAAAPRRARAEVGFVFTDPAAQILMPTPLEDVELSLRRAVPDRHERARGALRWLERLGMAHRASHSVFDLSGGERQLVALAAVLAARPRVLVLDEPTTLLDLRNRLRLTDLLDTLGQQQVISTHDLDLAATAQHVAVVHAGRIVTRGEPAATIARYRDWCARGFPEPA